MTRIRRSALLVGLALAPLVACADTGAEPMLILRNLAPGDGCTLESSDSTFISSGRIDANSSAGYLFTPVVRNDLTIVEGEPAAPKTIFLEGARIEIEAYANPFFATADIEATLRQFVAPVSGTIEPGGGTAALGFTIVPPALIDFIATEIGSEPGATVVLDVRVQLFGKRGGGEIESNTFRYPVEVCLGCLIADQGLCSALPDSFTARTGGACNPLQDGILDCCDNGLVCPARKPTAAL